MRRRIGPGRATSLDDIRSQASAGPNLFQGWRRLDIRWCHCRDRSGAGDGRRDHGDEFRRRRRDIGALSSPQRRAIAVSTLLELKTPNGRFGSLCLGYARNFSSAPYRGDPRRARGPERRTSVRRLVAETGSTPSRAVERLRSRSHGNRYNLPATLSSGSHVRQASVIRTHAQSVYPCVWPISTIVETLRKNSRKAWGASHLVRCHTIAIG